MCTLWRMFLLLMLADLLSIRNAANGLRVGIIGGGIGGASSAYFLRKHARPENDIQIDLFNHGEIGGRVTTVRMQHDGKERIFEAGGSVMHPANIYLKRWLKEFGLHKKETPREKGVLGVWDGSSFVFVKSSWYLVTLYRLLKKYGFDPLKNHFEIGSLLTDFKNIYDLLEMGQSFDTIDSMVTAMSTRLAKLLNMTFKDYLTENGYHDSFIKEYAAAALNCNYGQSVEELHGFVGAVGLAGSVSGLYSVNGSNKQVIEKLIHYSGARVISAEVATVSKYGNHFVLFDANGRELGGGYEYVIVAVPLHQKQSLQIDGQLSPVDYEKGEHFPTAGPNRIWKVFSKEDLTDSQLKQYFDEIRNVTKVSFLAYPDYKLPPSGHPKFRLSKNICFVNAVEWLASSIETSAIGGRNCVNMLLEDLKPSVVKKIAKVDL